MGQTMRNAVKLACATAIVACSQSPSAVQPGQDAAAPSDGSIEVPDATPLGLHGRLAFSYLDVADAANPVVNTAHIYTVDLSNPTASRVQISKAPGGQEDTEPSFDMAGTKIVFARDASLNKRELWIANADGSGEHVILSSTEFPQHPVFDAAGRIFYWSGSPHRIRVIDSDGAAPHDWALTPQGCDLAMSVSWDRTKLVIVTAPLPPNTCSIDNQKNTFVVPTTATTLPAPVQSVKANVAETLVAPTLGPGGRLYTFQPAGFSMVTPGLASTKLDGSDSRIDIAPPTVVKDFELGAEIVFTFDGAYLLTDIFYPSLARAGDSWGSASYSWKLGDAAGFIPLQSVPNLDTGSVLTWAP